MRMLDLFAGRLGWSTAFLAHGWKVTAIDLVFPPKVPYGCDFFSEDVLNCNARRGGWFSTDWGEWQFDFVCASPPCEEFSVHGMKHFHSNPKYPATGIKLFEHTRSICEASGVPYVIENVRAAQQFVGKAVHHCGPFYLWGNAVPPILPQGIKKGHRMLPGGLRERLKRNGADIKAERTKWEKQLNERVGTSCRQENIAAVATIPPELANAVCDFAERLIESRAERICQAVNSQ